MSRIFNALHQAELDQKTRTEASLAAWAPVQQPAKTSELPPSAWTTVEVEEAHKSAPATAESLTVEGAELPELAPPADIIVEELPQLAEPAPTEWAVNEALAEVPDSPVDISPAVQEPSPDQLEAVESIDLKTVDSTHLVAMADERGLGAEKFRVLAARLNNLRHSTKLKVLQVTSSVIGEGKTLVSANLAVTLAKRSSQRVLLLEGDLRKPALSGMFGLGKRPGLNEWWNGTESIGKFLLRAGETNLYLLPSVPVQHPASVLQSGRMADALAELAAEFDWVIIDTPPLLPMADSNLWARLADGTLLVVRKGVVTRTALKQAMETMDSPKLVGVVLNDATDFSQVNYYEQYYSGKPIKKQAAAKTEEGKSSE
jgi:capsular exopolysaccharide synthesis family protein